MKRASFSYEEAGSIRSVEHFLSEIKRVGGKGDFRLYFRGHGQPTKGLRPSIGREHFYLGRPVTFTAQQERNLLVQFRRHSYEHFGRIASEWENLFLARHHGLPTRLLDWSFSPLVALYFAAFYESEHVLPADQRMHRGSTEKLNVDGIIWAIQCRRDIAELDVLEDRRSPLRVPGIKLVFPFNPTPRMTAQSGIFTLHSDPWSDMVDCAGKAFPSKDLDVKKLIRWTVKSRDKMDIVLDLERLAINSRTLFPDVEGLARGLWQTEIIRQCFSEPIES